MGLALSGTSLEEAILQLISRPFRPTSFPLCCCATRKIESVSEDRSSYSTSIWPGERMYRIGRTVLFMLNL